MKKSQKKKDSVRGFPPLQPVLFQLSPERDPVDTEHLGGKGLVAADLDEYPFDVFHLLDLKGRNFPLLFPERFYVEFFQVFGEMGELNGTACRERHAAFDDVLQLPHVSRKTVIHEQGKHVR